MAFSRVRELCEWTWRRTWWLVHARARLRWEVIENESEL